MNIKSITCGKFTKMPDNVWVNPIKLISKENEGQHEFLGVVLTLTPEEVKLCGGEVGVDLMNFKFRYAFDQLSDHIADIEGDE